MYRILVEKYYQKIIEIPAEKATCDLEAENMAYKMWEDGEIKFTENDFVETICECMEEV